MRVAPGDVAGWVHRRRLQVCLVLSWSGDPDQHAQLLLENRTLALVYPYLLIGVGDRNIAGEVIVPPETAERVKSQLQAFLLTKAGKRLVARETPPTPTLPESGRGIPQRCDLPLQLARGMSSRLSRQMESYLDPGGLRSWCLAQLRLHNPSQYEVWLERDAFGSSFAEIAARHGVTEPYARNLYKRGQDYITLTARFYPWREREAA